jgi:hypothetical protein
MAMMWLKVLLIGVMLQLEKRGYCIHCPACVVDNVLKGNTMEKHKQQ